MRKNRSMPILAENIYIKEISNYKLLNAQEECEASRKYLNGDESAKDELIKSNLRFVVRIASKYVNRGLPMMDLIEEGNFGLMRAAEKFDPDKGFRFSTYASWWIKQNIERAIMNQGRTIRLPVHIIKKMKKFKRTCAKMSQVDDTEPSYEKLALKLDTKLPPMACRILEGNKVTVSLDKPISISASSTFEEVVKDENCVDPSTSIANEEINLLIAQWLGTLSSQQRDIIIRRFGLFGFDNMSLEKVSEDVGLTRERVRQIQYRALAALRRKISGQGLKPNILFKK